MCEICRQTPCNYRCPNYSPTSSHKICLFCEDAILDGEEYIENPDGECIHFECIPGIRQLLEFLGYKVKEMDYFEESNYETKNLE